MSTYTDSVLLAIGSVPGIGGRIASLFAKRRFNKVALIACNQERLQQAKKTVETAAGRPVDVRTWSVDISEVEKFKPVLSEIQKFGQLECVFFNAARVIPSAFFAHPESEIRMDLEVSTVNSLYDMQSD
jgi:short-subunit dehydrogenase